MPVYLHDKKFVPFLSAQQIAGRIKEMALQINADYEGKCPLFIAVLNGSFIFASELFQRLTIEAEISFIKLLSYSGTQSTGHINTIIGLEKSIEGRHIVILEDIIDTGKTLFEYLPELKKYNPATIRIATLLNKPDARIDPVQVDYCGFIVPNKFLIGFGLDYNGLGRNYSEIFQLDEE
jgi:hypoxanthine phosphoribosyltransferase